MNDKRKHDRADLLQQAHQWPWRHRIDVGGGFVTPGREDSRDELDLAGVPADLSGLRVLDIGCSDGAHSFMAEERGAEVVSIDNFLSTHYKNGRYGFDIAHKLRGSNAVFKKMSLYDLSELNPGGRFDMVFFFNVLYHLKHPLLALDKIRTVGNPGATLHVKTLYWQDVRVLGGWGVELANRPAARFLEGDELNSDPTNWWVPNKKCVEALLGAAGFVQVRNTHNRADRAYYSACFPN